jgi:hypothetical protein
MVSCARILAPILSVLTSARLILDPLSPALEIPTTAPTTGLPIVRLLHLVDPRSNPSIDMVEKATDGGLVRLRSSTAGEAG